MNHTRFPKEDHLPYWARRDNKVTKGHRVDYWTYLALLHDRKIVIGSGNWTDWTRLSQFSATEFSTIFSGWQSSSGGGPRAPCLKRRTFEPHDSAISLIWCHRTDTITWIPLLSRLEGSDVSPCVWIQGRLCPRLVVPASEGRLCSGVWNSDTFLCTER